MVVNHTKCFPPLPKPGMSSHRYYVYHSNNRDTHKNTQTQTNKHMHTHTHTYTHTVILAYTDAK